ncbi:MAG: ABC transporter permease [Anaerolineales bacterium]|nr:ABC transporter permease [Anaerolineales bacterium]
MSVISLDSRKKQSFAFDSPIIPPLFSVLFVWLLFWLFVPNFGTVRTVAGVFNAASINAIVVIGVTMLMIAGEFDLSVGAVMAMGGYIFANIMVADGSPVAAIGLALLVSTLMGAVNGLITVYTKLPSFIVTLGTLSIYRGLVWVYSGGEMVQTTEKLVLYDWLNGRLDFVNDLLPRANFRTATLWVILLAVLFQIILTRTRFGNHIFAAGGNAQAAIAQGVNIKQVKIICFALTGALAGLAGILTFSQFSSVFVATGASVELTAIAGAVVGGTLLTGGVGSIVGGLLGILLIDTLRSGVVLLGFPSDNFAAVVGVTIIGVALLIDWIRDRLS